VAWRPLYYHYIIITIGYFVVYRARHVRSGKRLRTVYRWSDENCSAADGVRAIACILVEYGCVCECASVSVQVCAGETHRVHRDPVPVCAPCRSRGRTGGGVPAAAKRAWPRPSRDWPAGRARPGRRSDGDRARRTAPAAA